MPIEWVGGGDRHCALLGLGARAAATQAHAIAPWEAGERSLQPSWPRTRACTAGQGRGSRVLPASACWAHPHVRSCDDTDVACASLQRSPGSHSHLSACFAVLLCFLRNLRFSAALSFPVPLATGWPFAGESVSTGTMPTDCVSALKCAEDGAMAQSPFCKIAFLNSCTCAWQSMLSSIKRPID